MRNRFLRGNRILSVKCVYICVYLYVCVCVCVAVVGYFVIASSESQSDIRRGAIRSHADD